MSDRPWFALSRGIFDHPRFSGVELCELSCFAWLVGNARWQDDEDIRRGQLVVTVPELVREWGWANRGKRPAEAVRRLLRKWSEGADPAITTEPVSEGGRTVGTLVTILRYDDWQRPANESLRGCRATHQPTHQPTHHATHQPTPPDGDGSEQSVECADAPADASRDASADAPRDTLLFYRHVRHVRHEQQRAHAREDAAAADSRLTWEAVRDLWVECRSDRPNFYTAPPANLGSQHLGAVRSVLDQLTAAADEFGIDDAWAHIAAVFEAYLDSRDDWLVRNDHPLPWLSGTDSGGTPRWPQWAMRDPWYAARVASHDHHVAETQAAPEPEPHQAIRTAPPDHAAAPGRPSFARAAGDDADEVRETLRQLVAEGIRDLEHGVLCRRGDGLVLVFGDELAALVAAKRARRHVPGVAFTHGTVEGEQRGAA